MIRVILKIHGVGLAPADVTAALMRSLRGAGTHHIEFAHVQNDGPASAADEKLIVAVSHLNQLREFEKQCSRYRETRNWRLEGSHAEGFQTLNEIIKEFGNLPEQVYRQFSNVLWNDNLAKYVDKDFLRRTLILLGEAYWYFFCYGSPSHNLDSSELLDSPERAELLAHISRLFVHIKQIAIELKHHDLEAEVLIRDESANPLQTDDIRTQMKALHTEVWKLLNG